MSKHEKVPETREIKPNREQRRHPEGLERPAPPEEEILPQGDQDVASVRAKNSGHGKKTADKWNQ
jgi:hypothetical protein